MVKSQRKEKRTEKSQSKFSTKGNEIKRDGKQHKKQAHSSSVPTPPPIAPAPIQQSVYKRETIYPHPTPWYTGPRDRFITPNDPDFNRVLTSSYTGYALEPKESFPTDFHSQFLTALESLDRQQIFQFDITQPAGLGTKLAKTFVTRCLVGEAGTTYKYLGLRMFSLPWGEEGGGGVESECRVISEVNQELVSHTKRLLEQEGRPAGRGHQYNLTLINRLVMRPLSPSPHCLFLSCYPESEIKLKTEPCFGRERCTVSWHADSSLEHFSSIAVYHVTVATPCPSTSPAPIPQHDKKRKDKKPRPSSGDQAGTATGEGEGGWKIALRVWPDAEGPTVGKAAKNSHLNELRAVPSLAIPLPNQSVYYLLDDFNHHHQHSGTDSLDRPVIDDGIY
jgi:mRNA N6-methyladenine demethylase